MAIKATIGAEISSFERAMSRVEQKAKQTGASMKALGDSMTKLVTGPLVAIGAGLLGASVSAANFADEIDKASIRSGLSAQRLQELRFVTDQVGVSFNTVEGAVDALRRRLPQLDNPGSRASETMERIGISAHGTNGELRDMDDLFPDIVRGLAGVTNETERGALATQILGRSASQLAPLLAQGEEGIADLTERAHELGLVMGNETISDLVDFKDEMAEVQQQIGASAREFGMVLMPILRNDVIPFFQNKLIPAIRAVAERFQNMDESTRRNLLVWGGLVAGIGPFLSITGRMIINMGPLITAFRKLTAVMLANPYVAVGAAVIALAGHLYNLNRRIRNSREELERLKNLDIEIADVSDFEKLQKAIIDVTESIKQEQEMMRLSAGRYSGARVDSLKEERAALIENLQQLALRIREEQKVADVVEDSGDATDENTDRIYSNTRALIDNKEARQELIDTVLGDELSDLDIDLTFGEGDMDDIAERMRMGLGVSIAEVEQAMRELREQHDRMTSEESREGIRAVIEEYENMHQILTKNTKQQIYEFGLLDGAMAGAINQIDLFGDGWNNVGETVKGVMKQIINDLARMAAMRGFQALLGISTGGAGFAAALFGGFRADGGPVNRGNAYVVGERGPEMFVPDTSGTIIPNGGSVNAGAISGGGGVQSINLTGRFKVEGSDLVYVIDEYNRQVNNA